jgi:prephenate dehydratase
MMKIVFQGESGAYSEEAIIKHYGESVEPLPRPYFRDVFDAVEKGEAKLGLVPVENTIEGSIVRNYDLLNERSLTAQGEVILRIKHCLIVNPGAKLENIKRVYSHPQALGQSRAYLEEMEFEAISAYDTAGSVKMIKSLGVEDAAAIASSRAAEVYDMAILKRGIETNSENYTRFLAIGHGTTAPTGRDKTSLAFIVEHRPGTLYTALKAFVENEIDLTKIESRPLIGSPFEYVFFVDILGHSDEPTIRKAIEALEASSRTVKILGSYPVAER